MIYRIQATVLDKAHTQGIQLCDGKYEESDRNWIMGKTIKNVIDIKLAAKKAEFWTYKDLMNRGNRISGCVPMYG